NSPFGEGLDLLDPHFKRVARLRPLDPDGPRHRVRAWTVRRYRGLHRQLAGMEVTVAEAEESRTLQPPRHQRLQANEVTRPYAQYGRLSGIEVSPVHIRRL